MWLVEALGYKLKTPKKNWSRHLPGSHMFFLPVPSSNNKLYDLFQIQSPPQHQNMFLGAWSATIGRRLTKKGILVRSPAFLILDVEIIGGVRRQDKGCLGFCGAGWRPLLFFLSQQNGEIQLDDYLWLARICTSCLEHVTQIVGFEVNVS